MKSRLSPQTTTEIQALLSSFLQSWNNKHLDAFMENFVEEAEFTDVVGQTAIGLEAIRKQHEFAFNVVMKHASFEMANELMREILPDVVMVSANWLNKNSQTPDGRRLPDRNGVLQFVMVKDEASAWKIRLVHNADFSLPYEKRERFME
ncbi:MAG: SgcJ/EcaC family oxidoreductase [Bacteroidia bacterium]